MPVVYSVLVVCRWNVLCLRVSGSHVHEHDIVGLCRLYTYILPHNISDFTLARKNRAGVTFALRSLLSVPALGAFSLLLPGYATFRSDTKEAKVIMQTSLMNDFL